MEDGKDLHRKNLKKCSKLKMTELNENGHGSSKHERNLKICSRTYEKQIC